MGSRSKTTSKKPIAASNVSTADAKDDPLTEAPARRSDRLLLHGLGEA